jgi:hypothetical protein
VQKPILQLLSPSGRTFAFVKVGTNDLTRELVRAETANLRRLAQHRLRTVRLPEILYAGQWNGNEVLVLSAVRRSRIRRLTAGDVAAAGVELSRVDVSAPQPLLASAYWRRLCGRLEALPDTVLAKSLQVAVAEMEELFVDTRVRLGSWHGDWAPWNMTRSDAGVSVWDWEQFESGVPVGLDAVHYNVQQAVVYRGTEPAEAFAAVRGGAVRLLAPYGVEGVVARATVLLYLVEIAVRYLHDGEVDLDATQMGRLDGWLLPTLARQMAWLKAPSG